MTPSGETAGPRAGVPRWQVGVTWTAPALELMCIPGEICRGKAQDRNARLGTVDTDVSCPFFVIRIVFGEIY